MATFTWKGYMGAGPGWADIGVHTICFSGSRTDITAAIPVDSLADGTHIGDGDGTGDSCGANHMNNVKYLTDSTMSVNGGGSENITDANLAETECTLQITFADTNSVSITNARLYCFDGSVTTNPAVGCQVYGFERGKSNVVWTEINDESANVGGDNAGEHLDLADSAATSTSHVFYIALSAGPESVGGKGSFDIGIALTYS